MSGYTVQFDDETHATLKSIADSLAEHVKNQKRILEIAEEGKKVQEEIWRKAGIIK